MSQIMERLWMFQGINLLLISFKFNKVCLVSGLTHFFPFSFCHDCNLCGMEKLIRVLI